MTQRKQTKVEYKIKCPNCETAFDVTEELEIASEDLRTLRRIVKKYSKEREE